MKNLSIFYALIIMNSLMSMELNQTCSLLDIFGVPEKYNELPIELSREITLRITTQQWWYPHTELHLNSAEKKKKIANATVKFSPSGNKVGITNVSGISTWNTQDGALETLVEFLNSINILTFNKDETKIFASGYRGHIFFRDLTLREKHGRIGESARCFLLDKIISSHYLLSDDGTKAILGRCNKAILINTLTGTVEQVLWENSDRNNHDKVTAFFLKDTSTVHVIHNGFLSIHQDNENVRYKAILPANTYLPLYSSEKNRLIYFHSEGKQVSVRDYATQEEKKMDRIVREGGDIYTVELIDQGKKLLCTQFRHPAHRSNRFSDFNKHCCFIDIYDLDNLCLINSIPLDAEPECYGQKNLLLLSFSNKIELWDIFQPSLLVSLICNEEIRSVDFNEQVNKIIVATNDVMIWDLYKPTLKQLLLKQLLLHWFELKRQLTIFDSPDSLLIEIANTLLACEAKKNTTERQGLNALKKDFIETWNSFPEDIKFAMWRTLQKKMKRNREYSLSFLSVRIKEARKNQKNKQIVLLQQAPAYIPPQKYKQTHFSHQKDNRRKK